MGIIARITYLSRNRKTTNCFYLEKFNGKYWWILAHSDECITLNFFLKKEVCIVDGNKRINFFIGLPFEGWHLSKLAIKYNENISKNM